ncbi:MAG: lipopolysaccharide kinase InaA family protein [Victivallaceae bacterium]
MSSNLTTVIIDDWKWRLKDPEVLNSWFKLRKEYEVAGRVKSNPVRKVFKIDDDYFVKHDTPEKFIHHLRALFSSKCKREFETALQLEEAGVPVVEYLGWGRKGSESMLLSRTFPGSISAREYWYREFVYGKHKPDAFIDQLCAFIADFFESGFFHPDFHSGNILYSPETGTFALVDVYGIQPQVRLDAKQREAQNRIVFDLQEGLTDKLAVKFILQTSIRHAANDALNYWLDGLKQDAERTMASWPKRKRQFLDHYEKFIETVITDDNEFLIRKDNILQPAVNPETVPDSLSGNIFDIRRLPIAEAEKLWLTSFKLQLFGIDHIRPLVFELPSILYYEKIPDGIGPVQDAELLREFNRKCEFFGIAADPKNQAQLPDGRIVLKSIDQLELKL